MKLMALTLAGVVAGGARPPGPAAAAPRDDGRRWHDNGYHHPQRWRHGPRWRQVCRWHHGHYGKVRRCYRVRG